MGIQNSGNPVPPKQEKDVTTVFATAFVVSTQILASNTNRTKYNVTNNNPSASLWITSDPAITTATAALPCVEIPPGANGDFEASTAVRATYPVGTLTTSAGLVILETLQF